MLKWKLVSWCEAYAIQPFYPNLIVTHISFVVKPLDQKWGMKKERFHERG